MALSTGEFRSGGKVWSGGDTPTPDDNDVVFTTSLVDAKHSGGFLRDPDGRIVVVVK